MIKTEKLRNDSHSNTGIHMSTILFEIETEKQIENGTFSGVWNNWKSGFLSSGFYSPVKTQ